MKDTAEAFFPGEYTKLSCSGSIPKDGWLNAAKICSSNEIELPPHLSQTKSIPIDNIVHTTHRDSARGIKRKGRPTEYTFEPKAKRGKSNLHDSENQGSFKKISERNSFQKIRSHERVLPGNLSWWGLDTIQWYKSDDKLGQTIGKEVKFLRDERIFVAPFMSNPAESRYGDTGLIVSFKNALQSYKDSRTDLVDPKVCLRVAGTLRYRYEICYVVIVCTTDDKELECYPSLHNCKEFDDKGFVHESGRIRESFYSSTETIDFKPELFIKSVPQKKYSSYETPAFPFYYPENENGLRLAINGDFVTERKVTHACKKLCK